MKCIGVIITVMLFYVGLPLTVKGQACPACSNPALQSSEKLEAGLDTLNAGAFRTTLNLTSGFNYQGGHPNWKGLTASGEVIDVPLHDHVVSLDFLRTEFSFEYTFKKNWSAWLRIPYDVKHQEASIEYVEPVNETEKAAILRNRDIHHRNETYTGLSDFRFLVAHRINGIFGKNGRLDVALGTSLPVGETEGDPLTAGKIGEKHMHIQFGTGTFDPLLELHYATFLTDKTSLALYTINKIPFYENSHGYQGPVETTSGVSLGYQVFDWMVIRGTFANFSQSYAEWNGVKDPNSGLISYNGNLGVTFRTLNGLLIAPGYRFPVSQRTLSNEGDTFEYGSTFLLNISYLFNSKDTNISP
jgi:hypothetical protein